MNNVGFHCSNFSSIASGLHNIQIDWTDLVWAAVTYGKKNAQQLTTFNWHSIAELIVRAHTVYAYLRNGISGYEKSDLYSHLDATEKGAASYFIGMTICKIFADRMLNTPWLFHVSHASFNGIPLTFSKMTKERPDLLGLTSTSDWIVAEAKGRSKAFSKNALIKAKKQSTMIKSVNGKIPLHRFGIQAYFDPFLKATADDPPASRDAYPVEIDVSEALTSYYALASVLSRHGDKRNVRGDSYLITEDVASGISIGLPASLARDSFEVPSIGSLLRDSASLSIREKIYSDGIYISLDERWAPENMARQPADRGVTQA